MTTLQRCQRYLKQRKVDYAHLSQQDVMRVSFSDYARVVNPLIAAFAVEAPAEIAH